MYAWGANDFGQLGLADSNPRFDPVEVEGFGGAVRQILAVDDSSFAVTMKVGVRVWPSTTADSR